ncbi:hypothetical protein PC129_g19664 [Phytophthora cactorum]|nr:hypothetical protein Pcac1_g7127 [Phytophthora cactorum]KAG2803391.1 hypothetical protein PC112_g19191 [Phytophthora cactorum]KAG2804398.1 hypothetical protein PC111_g18276 [Phytophthora cactorum]KAG2841183.1 hypothetical protein PC113_g19096 [Phytophthora cactorum]KAG2893190.1 hypothetical protein PC115_g18556 [Phytophthora cactorum]
MRIRHALSRKCSTPTRRPTISKECKTLRLQLLSNLHGNHDRVDKLKAWVHERAYNGSESMTESFTFAWQLDNGGKPIFGNGSDKKPFIVGILTKATMLRLTIPPESFTLHLDVTNKTNQCEYHDLVVGVSDRSRRFHLVALFVISEETQPVFQAALLALRRQHYWITHKHLQVRYATAGGD